ncbi:hypothetical protein ACOSP7_016949 [Xanthoceras sorbifolium]
MNGPDLIWIALLHGFIKFTEISPWIHQIHGDLSMDSSNSWSFPATEGGGRGRLSLPRSKVEEPGFFVDGRTLGSSIDEEPRNFWVLR